MASNLDLRFSATFGRHVLLGIPHVERVAERQFCAPARAVAARGGFGRGVEVAASRGSTGEGRLRGYGRWWLRACADLPDIVRTRRVEGVGPTPDAELGEPHVAVRTRGDGGWARLRCRDRSEEHTSELQSRELISYAVFCL